MSQCLGQPPLQQMESDFASWELQIRIVNYKLALAESIYQSLNNSKSICHLPLRRLNPVLLQPLTFDTPWRQFRVESEALWAPGKLVIPRSLDRYFQELISWSQSLHLLISSENESCSVLSDSLQPQGLYSPWNSPGQNTGMGSLSLLQGILPTQGLNPGLLHCRQILYQLSQQGSPRILEWVVHPFSSGSSQPKNQTGVSCTAGEFFTNWATRKAPSYVEKH